MAGRRRGSVRMQMDFHPAGKPLDEHVHPDTLIPDGRNVDAAPRVLCQDTNPRA